MVFRNVNAIDAVHGLRRDQTIVVKKAKIAEVGASSDVRVPSDGRIVDGRGKYLIPGLWDAHVHLTFNASITPAMFPLLIVNGITSIRDTGGRLETIDQNRIQGPHRECFWLDPWLMAFLPYILEDQAVFPI